MPPAPQGPQTPPFIHGDSGPTSGLPELVGPISLSPRDGTLQQEESKPESGKHLSKERRAVLHQVHCHLPSRAAPLPAMVPVLPSLPLHPLLIQAHSAGQHWGLNHTSTSDRLCV